MTFKRLPKNVMNAAETSKKGSKKRSLRSVNEHLRPLFDAVLVSVIVLRQPVRLPLLLILLMLLGMCDPADAQEQDIHAAIAREDALGAAFIMNFVMFTEWPSLPKDTFTICATGVNQSMSNALQKLKAKQLKNRAVEIVAPLLPAQLSSCQVLFIGKLDPAELDKLNKKIAATPVLLISDNAGFPLSDVIILLSRQQGRLSFKINQSAAQMRSLRLSSKLLQLATEVY